MKRVTLEIHQTRRFSKQLQAMYKVGKNERIDEQMLREIFAGLYKNISDYP